METSNQATALAFSLVPPRRNPTTFRHANDRRRGRWSRLVLALGSLLLAPSSSAVTVVELRIEPPPAAPTHAVLSHGDGQRLEADAPAGTGSMTFLPEKTGRWELTVELARGARASINLDVAAGDEVSVVYRPADTTSPFLVEQHQLEVFESELVVTARRREEDIARIPVAVTAFSQEAMKARSMRDLSDVADFTPNVDFSASGGAGGAPSEATLYIRGVGQIETGVFADPGVAIYVDGVYLARSQGSVLDLLDLERVEILRGPQGTLFGKNSTGGAMQLITRRPGPERSGSLHATGGDLDRLDIEGRLSGAFSDRVFASLAFASRNRDGYQRSLASGATFGDENRDTARLALRWLADDRTVVDFSFDRSRERESVLDQRLVDVYPADLLDFYNEVLVGGGLAPLTTDFITDDPYTSLSDFPSFSHGDISLATLRLQRTTSRFDLLSITASRDVEYRGSSDFDGSPFDLFARSYVQTQDQLSQELQLTGTAGERLDWVVGALYFEENPVDDGRTFSTSEVFPLLEAAPGAIYAPPGFSSTLCNPGPPPPGLPCFGGAGNLANLAFFQGDGVIDVVDIETTSWAIFGEGNWALGDRTSLSAGLRYTFEEKDFRFFTDPRNSPARTLRDKDDYAAWSPRLSLSHQVRDDLMVYLSASKGFKSGGFNAGRSQARTSIAPYEQEELWAYEAGLKATLFDRRLRLSGALFAYNYDNVQFASFLVIDNELFLAVQNAANAQIRGVELETEWLPAKGLRITSGLGWIDTEYTELFSEGAPQDGVIPKTPEWTFDLSVQRAWEKERLGRWVARADLSYRSAFFHDVANSPQVRQEGYELLNLRLGWSPSSELWELSFFATNVGDTVYLEHGFNSPPAGSATAITGRPREWGISLEWRF